ncbi:MAG: class B sortase [Muribaculum sp.]|nr:class B sortase [Muribaculum sp.]
MNTLKTKIYILLGITAVICLAAAISLTVYQQTADQRAEELLDRMQMQAENRADPAGDEASAGTSPAQPSSEENDGTQEDPALPLVDNPYQDSFLANDDMAAWLRIEDTGVDYPVMWTPREETYYLYRNFEGRDDQNGCLILDTDSFLDPLSTNLIIHGHNMRSGAMFGNLTEYEKETYCKEHNLITLYTEQVERRYEVIAVFRSQVYKKTDTVFKFYKFFQADTQEEFDDFYRNIKALSLYDTGVTAEFGDHFITLSTCVYHVEQGRFVVVAKEIENGDHYAPFREK